MKTGDEVELDLDKNTLTLVAAGKVISTKSLGDARPVIDAGGIVDFARQSGMIKARGDHSAATERLAAREPAAD